MHNYQPGLALDEATLRGLANLPVTVTDDETGLPVQVYRAEMPVPQLITGPHGFITPFQTEESTRRVRVTVGAYSLTVWADELIGAAGEAITQLERLTVSHVTFDTDGVPAIVQGSASARIIYDTDGVPVIVPNEGVTA